MTINDIRNPVDAMFGEKDKLINVNIEYALPNRNLNTTCCACWLLKVRSREKGGRRIDCAARDD